MKRLRFLAALIALAALGGCGDKDAVVTIKELPEIDHTALDRYMMWEKAEIAHNRLHIFIMGTATEELVGDGTERKFAISVQRFKDGSPLDTVTAYITRKPDAMAEPTAAPKRKEDAPAPGRPPQPGEAAPLPSPRALVGPEYRVPPIQLGDAVRAMIDATCVGGQITKMVITPQ